MHPKTTKCFEKGWSVQAGRSILCNGVECFSIRPGKAGALYPVELDAMAHFIASKLNDGGFVAFYNQYIKE